MQSPRQTVSRPARNDCERGLGLDESFGDFVDGAVAPNCRHHIVFIHGGGGNFGGMSCILSVFYCKIKFFLVQMAIENLLKLLLLADSGNWVYNE